VVVGLHISAMVADGAGARYCSCVDCRRIKVSYSDLSRPVYPLPRIVIRLSLRSPRCAASRMKTGMYRASDVVSPVTRAVMKGAEVGNRPFEDPLQLCERASGPEDECRV
jgi:hypothetical protein